MLLDTSGLLSLLHYGERQHPAARDLFNSASSKMTHNYVLAEFVPLVQARRLPCQPALAFLKRML